MPITFAKDRGAHMRSTALLLAALAAGGAGSAMAQDQSSEAKGDVTICGPTDASGIFGDTVAAINETYPELNVDYIPLGAAATDQLQQISQRMQTRSTQCDIVRTDVVWTAQLAAQGYLEDVSDFATTLQDRLIPSTIATASYNGKFYAVPFYTNTHLMYYRTDRVEGMPKSWQELYSTAEQSVENQLLYQALPGETLTISFLNLLYSDDGEVIDSSGNVVVDSPKTVDVLSFMQAGIQNGAAPKAVLTYNEDATRLAYEAGNGAYMSNWPYAYARGQQSQIAGKFAVAPLPAYGKDGVGRSVLGGTNLAVNVYSENKPGALKVLEFVTSEAWQETVAADYSLAPVSTAAYSAQSVKDALPFAAEMLDAVTAAKPRPVSPVYPQISQAISDQVSAVLSGKISPEDAARAMAEGVKQAQQTF